jgi:tetratricopeptide (TPR) repeat protein
MMHKKLLAIISASVLCTVMAVATAPAFAQDINYNLPSAEDVQKQKDSRSNQAVSERVGRRLMNALDMYTEEKDVKGAIEMLEDTDPSDDFDRAYVNRFLGNLYAADEQYQRAVTLVKQAADANVLGWSDHAAMLKLVADLSLQLEQYETALQYYGKWLQFTGEADADVFMRIANSYYQLKQYDKIIQPADLAIKSFAAKGEPNRNPYIMKVASYYERKMYPEAAAVLESGLAVLPGEKVWWNQLGMIYMLMERFEKSLQTMEIAYLAGYFDKETHYKALVQLYSNMGIPYKAAMIMEKHIKAGDVEAIAKNYQMVASNYEQSREYDKAAVAYGLAAKAETEAEERANMYRRQGTAYLRAEQYTKAVDAYVKALNNGIEKEGPVYMSITEAHFYNNNFREALKSVQEAKKFSDQRRNASSWEQYIRQKASNRGVSL